MILFSAITEAIKWFRHFIYFSKAVSALLGLVLAHGLVKNGVTDILMLYLTQEWKEHDLMKSAAIVNFEEAISGVIAVIICLLTGAWIGRFKMVIYSTTSFILGLVLLCLSTSKFSSDVKAPVIYVALLLISIGKAGKDPPFKNFLRDQLPGDDVKQVDDRTNFWWRGLKFIGATISVFFLTKTSWEHNFITSASVMGTTFLMFLAGMFSPYNYTPPTGNSFSVLYNVVKSAYTKRCLSYPRTPSRYFLNRRKEQPLFPPDPILRFLDKAAIMTRASPSQHQEEEEENLCSAAEVRQTKSLLRLIPLWFAFIIYGIVTASGNTFFVEQSNGLHETISINSLFIMMSLVSLVTSYLTDLLLSRYCKNETWKLKAALIRVGAGMAISIVCCQVATQVEHKRLNALKKLKPNESEYDNLDMSILWLAPQYILLGLMGGLAEDGLSDLLYIIVGKSMEGLETPINQLILATGKAMSIGCVFISRGWFGDTINTSRLDKYFNMLMYLSVANLALYLVIGYYYVYVQNQQEKEGGRGGGYSIQLVTEENNDIQQNHDIQDQTG
ncbi:Major facilitator superfamily protein [Euphorbia peplus]|nr:Major facilitator superfamily protein [Euphorbia peplus]